MTSGRFICRLPVADLRKEPGAGRDRQLRHGEDFVVETRRDGHAFGHSVMAGHRGWLAEDALGPGDTPPDRLHSVCARQTHAYALPDLKSPERCALPHLARVAVLRHEGRFAETAMGWIPVQHLTDALETDPVAVAALYLGVPYLWGGNSIWGIDCSGLVHAALTACGTACPSDSGPQERALGETLPEGTPPRRGDLLFWKGHVAWVSDPDTILHANAHAMAVTHEPLRAAIARIEAQGGGPVTRHARMAGTPPRA